MEPIEPQHADGHEVDFLWPEQRVIAEADGHLHDRTPAAAERHNARVARLTAAGYRVVRFTHSQLEHEPEKLTSALRTLLEH
jgi:very-short-patch-repair endonuclease